MTSAEQATPQRQRPCGYSGCEQTIPYQGRGRPREYCGRVWDDGESCQQKAEAQRAAARAAGLEGPLEAYRQISEQTRPALESLAGQLEHVREALGTVESGALERIATAEAAAVAAAERAEAAEHDRDTASSRAAVAEQQRQQAAEAQGVAERRARDAEATAEESQQRAWREVAEHDHRRGQAETARDEAKTSLSVLQQRFDRLAGEADELGTTNKELSRKLAAAEAGKTAAETARDTASSQRDEFAAAATAASTRAEHAEAETTRLRDERDTAQHEARNQQENATATATERDQLAERLSAAEQRLTDRATELERLRDDLTAAQTRAETAPTREQIADMIRTAVHTRDNEPDTDTDPV